jgi:hypothetical protein
LSMLLILGARVCCGVFGFQVVSCLGERAETPFWEQQVVCDWLLLSGGWACVSPVLGVVGWSLSVPVEKLCDVAENFGQRCLTCSAKSFSGTSLVQGPLCEKLEWEICSIAFRIVVLAWGQGLCVSRTLCWGQPAAKRQFAGSGSLGGLCLEAWSVRLACALSAQLVQVGRALVQESQYCPATPSGWHGICGIRFLVTCLGPGLVRLAIMWLG